jgi:hypothetical protein
VRSLAVVESRNVVEAIAPDSKYLAAALEFKKSLRSSADSVEMIRKIRSFFATRKPAGSRNEIDVDTNKDEYSVNKTAFSLTQAPYVYKTKI